MAILSVIFGDFNCLEFSLYVSKFEVFVAQFPNQLLIEQFDLYNFDKNACVEWSLFSRDSYNFSERV